jgi:hypothetical protein
VEIKIMRIVIETIEHKDQRYPTVGDWFYDYTYFCKECSQSIITPRVEAVTCAGCRREHLPLINVTLNIRVSKLPSWKMEALIAVHELVECMLCKSDGIDQVTVDKFDMEFEKDRAVGNEDEPGDDPHAPYHGQHCFATGVERLLAATIGVKWNDYADEIEKLP